MKDRAPSILRGGAVIRVVADSGLPIRALSFVDLQFGDAHVERRIAARAPPVRFSGACTLGPCPTARPGVGGRHHGISCGAMARDVAIRGDTIRLRQLLKLAGVIEGGGEAKGVLAGKGVWVNGEREARRGRQLHRG